MLDWSPSERCIFVTLAGSHAHGTAGPGSDVDLRGVCVAPLRTRLSYRESEHFAQREGPLEGDVWQQVRSALTARLSTRETTSVEAVVFDVAKLIRLCAEANPNALEILFAAQDDWLFSTPVWRQLHERRHAFLSAKVEQTYVGYALSQLKRIQTHRSWLLQPPVNEPRRADFGLPERSTLSADDRVRIEQALSEEVLELPPAVLRVLDAERRYRSARKHWEAFRRWKSQRNRARAELEARFGYDTKHAAHLLRLMRTGIELLESGELHVKRADAMELRAVRDGALSYDDLISQARTLETRMKAAAASTRLPTDVDHEVLDELLFDLITTGGLR